MIPIAYGITEAYKLFIKMCPASVIRKRWMTALIPTFAILFSVLMSILFFDLNFDALLNGIIVGLSAIGLYDGIKYSVSSGRKLSINNVTPPPNG